MASTQLGLEIDGDHVTLVEVSGGLAVASKTVMHSNLGTAIALALEGYKQRRTDGPVRVVLACSGMNLRRVDVTANMLHRLGFENAVFAAMPVPRETNSASGVFFQPDEISGDIVTPGIAVIAPTALVDKTYEAFGRRATELVASPTIFSGLDGVWLGVRNRTADVTLVTNGRPVAYRQLRCGGLDTVAATLGDGKQGQARLTSTMYATGPSDPIAEAEINRYLSNLALELRQTCDYWNRSGESVPGVISAYGVGAGAPGVSRALIEQGFELGLHPEVEKRLVYLPAADRASAVAGFLAAVTVGMDMPQVAFVNPYAVKFAEDQARRDRRARRLLTFAIGIGIVSLVGGIPYISSQLALREAKTDLAAAQESFASASVGYNKISDSKLRIGAAEQIRSTQPGWSQILSVTFGTIPNGATVRDLSASVINGDIQVSVTAERKGGSYNDLTRWLEKLRANAGVTAAWSESFSDRDGRAVFELSYTLVKPQTKPADTASSSAPGDETATVTDGSAPVTETVAPGEDPNVISVPSVSETTSTEGK